MSGRQVALLIQFDGTDFHGWQTQAGLRTVQATVQDALQAMTGEETTLRASSRTDAGVHARALPAMFRTAASIPAGGFMRGLNGTLPADVSIVAAADVGSDFDVRRSGRGKVYRYRVWNAAARSALAHRTSWFVPQRCDPALMERAAQALVGDHDFESFRAAGCQAKTSIRTLTRIAVDSGPGGVIEITVEGNAFLQHMVRIIAGTLVEVGRGRREEAFPAEALAARRRDAAGQTAPARGLTLERVLYDPSPFEVR